MGSNSPGTRGTHDSPASPNMPAKTPRKQGDFSGSGKGGVHDTDPPGNGVKRFNTGGPSTEGKNRPLRSVGSIEFGKADPRRSHS